MISANTTELTVQQPFYFPLQSGRYEVKPGLFQFPYNFNNGATDKLIFQFDDLFSAYRNVKFVARKERLDKYYCHTPASGQSIQQVNQFIIETLCRQNPNQFERIQEGNLTRLNCRLTNESLFYDAQMNLLEVKGLPSAITYQDGFDALANQLQDDLAVIQLDKAGKDFISSLHLCYANHWSAEAKIGRSFIDAHSPVPQISKINRHADKLIHSLINKGPFVRFAWGIATDTRLNHHPAPPAGISPQNWQGRTFDSDKPELYLRVERQTLHGLPQAQTVLFTIRTYFYDMASIVKNNHYRTMLVSAIHSMSDEALSYKGLLDSKADMLDWLQQS